MRAIRARLRAELRARWRAWLALGILLGLLSGFVVAAAAGARRTDSAYPRFLKWSNAFDVLVPTLPPPLPQFDLDQIAAMPQVAQSQKFADLVVMIHNDPSETAGLTAIVPSKTPVSRPRIVAGRMPRPEALDEVAVSWFDMKRLGARLGGMIHVVGLPPGGSLDSRGGFEAGQPQAKAPALDLRVVGIVVSTGDFPTSGAAGATDIVSPALVQRYRSTVTSYGFIAVRLRKGADSETTFEQAITAQLGSIEQQQNFQLVLIGPQEAAIQRSFHLQAVALWILGGAAGITMLVVLSQLLARNVFIESTEFPSMRALGMTRSELVDLTLIRGTLIAATASLVALAFAFALSPITPIGTARLADPHPGAVFDAVAIGIGVGALVIMVLVVSAIAGWRLARSASIALGTAEVAGAKPSAAAGALERASMPATAVAGVRLGLEPGRGRTAVPVRTTLVSVAVGLAALVGALTFGRSLGHLTSTPRLYGVGWDTEVDAPGSTGDVRTVILPLVRRMPGVEAIGMGGADVTVKVSDAGVDPATHGIPANGFIFQNVFASVVPDALQGRLPVAPDEIALGSKTMVSLHKKIGDMVALDIANFVQLKFRVVGVVTVPPFSSTARLGQGTMFNFSAASRVQGAPPPSVMWIRFASPKAKRDIVATIRNAVPGVTVYGTPTPDDIVNLGKLTTLPLVLAGLLALLAAATLTHAIVTAVRRRRRDLAILKTLGFVRGQVRRTVAWQAGSLVVIPMIVAIPAGIAIGRALWDLLASQLGIHPEPIVPGLSVGLIAPAAIALALLIAWLPGRLAARTRPAMVLRTE